MLDVRTIRTIIAYGYGECNRCVAHIFHSPHEISHTPQAPDAAEISFPLIGKLLKGRYYKHFD